jgi:diacylglycerol O-acyltransferase
MSRLSLIDSIFLWVETQEIPAHVAGLQIFELPRGKGEAWLRRLFNELRQQAPGIPFNQRLKHGAAARPELVEDEEFDIDYHVRHTVLPSPGSEEQLRNLVARMHSHLLDRDRPLWEFYLIQGLEGRRFAFYIKIHHAICDGATFSKWMAESTAVDPESTTPPIWSRARRHSGVTHRPWLESLQAPASLLRTGSDVGLGLGRIAGRLLRKRLVERDSSVALPLSGPGTALNTGLTASRNLAFCAYPVADLKAMGRPLGGSLNDVLLALCDAALRRYLGEQGQDPDGPLVAAVPVNLRQPGDESEGNFVTSLQVKLGDAGLDPAEHVTAVSHSVDGARELYQGVPQAATQAYSFATAGFAALVQTIGLDGVVPPPMNLIISNVPGPREARSFHGARLEATYPVSGIAPMTTLNVTVYSYNGILYVGLIADRRALPHLEDLKACLDEIYAEYREALLGDAA